MVELLIRQATNEDILDILLMAKEFWQVAPFAEEFCPNQTQKMIELSLSHGLLAVAEDKDEVCGFISAIKGPLLCSTQSLIATELAWFVKPKKRGKLHGIELLKFLERLCIEQDVKYLIMLYMEESMPEQVKRMYLEMGYTLQESSYRKVL